jgi:hypothetical protein
MFVILTAEVAKQFHLNPTRNSESKHCNSACDIVVVAINRTKWLRRTIQYKAVEALWLQWSDRL